MAKDYAVGYGRPPRANQFKRGKSGNPKGRPKGSRELDDQMRKLLSKKYPITEGGVRTTATMQEILLTQLCKHAMAGKPHAMTFVLDFIRKFSKQAEPQPKYSREQLLAMTDQERVDLYRKTIAEGRDW